MDQQKLIDELVDANHDLIETVKEYGIVFDRNVLVDEARQIRAMLSPVFGGADEDIQSFISAGAAFKTTAIKSQAATEYKRQSDAYKGHAIDGTVLAAQRIAEDILDLEGDVACAVTSPIEMSLTSNVWVQGKDKGLVKEVNALLPMWHTKDIIHAAWQDLETYSAFYVSMTWDGEYAMPIHWSPKRIAVGPFDWDEVGQRSFEYLPTDTRKRKKVPEGDEAQTMIDFFEAVTGKEWNDWKWSQGGAQLLQEFLVWDHFMKPKHKKYPYPQLAKAATPTYTRQIIEEMRLALVQGVIAQLWVMTLESPMPKEVARLKEVLAANRAERVGFLIWRKGLEVANFAPQSIQELLMPEMWWGATLDIFRRIGRSVRIISGETAKTGQAGSGDAEVDVRIAQQKAMGHRQVVAEKVVNGLVRQYGVTSGNQALVRAVDRGQVQARMTPIQLFLGEDLSSIWSPMWTLGMASVRTIHAGLGLDTDVETELLKEEEEQGYNETYISRQQFAQRVATPDGDVTRSTEPGRPEGAKTNAKEGQRQVTKASEEDITERLTEGFDAIEEGEVEERRRKVTAFIALLTALIGIHMKGAYRQGYADAYGDKPINQDELQAALDWERDYVVKFEQDLMSAVDMGASVAGMRYRVKQHVQGGYKRAYMAGVFQAKKEDGWTGWRRVLRPWASKTGPCEVCIADSRTTHPITEPFWDHPYGVCGQQFVRFVRHALNLPDLESPAMSVPMED